MLNSSHFSAKTTICLFICVPSDASSLPLLAGYLLLGNVFYLFETMKMWARSIQPKFRSVRPGKVVHLKRWTSFFRNFSGWTELIHWVLDQNFRKFWLNGLRPWLKRSRTVSSTWSRLYVQPAYCAEENSFGLIFAQYKFISNN